MKKTRNVFVNELFSSKTKKFLLGTGVALVCLYHLGYGFGKFLFYVIH